MRRRSLDRVTQVKVCKFLSVAFFLVFFFRCVTFKAAPFQFWISGIFCIFTVTPSKIKIQNSQYRIFRIWEMKEDKYTKSLAKNEVCAIIHIWDIRKNVLTKFTICMTPCWCPFKGHKIWPLETNRNICFWVFFQLMRKFIAWGKSPFIVTATAISFDNTKSHKGLPLFDVLCWIWN